MVWDNSAEERYWLEWLDDKPWTTLWIDGNHENFNMLKKYPVENWHGGKIQKITYSIFHLCRGNIFEIDGKRVFAFGGAESHDKHMTVKKFSLYTAWKRMRNDYIHIPVRRFKSLPAVSYFLHIWKLFFPHCNTKFAILFTRNRLTDFFDEVDKKTNFKLWFSGHYHRSGVYYQNHILIYNDIVKLTDTGFERVYPKGKR